MGEQSRVLTVTFGTFSCTLQGFDDPFPILRQIADYFSEISRKDPAFGTQTGMVNADALSAIAAMTGAEAAWTPEGDLSVQAPEADSSETIAETPLAEEISAEAEPKGEAEVELAAPVEDGVAEDSLAEEPVEEAPAEATLAEETVAADDAPESDPIAAEDKAEDTVTEQEEDTAKQDTATEEAVAASAPLRLVAAADDAPAATTDDAPQDAPTDDARSEEATSEDDVTASDLPEWAADLIAEGDDDADMALTTAAGVDFEGDFEDSVADASQITDADLVAATEKPLVLDNVAAPDPEPKEAMAHMSDLPVVAGTETDNDLTPEPFEDPEKEYTKKSVKLAFGQTPGLDQTRSVQVIAPNIPEVALNHSGLFEETDETEETAFAFAEGPSGGPAPAPVPPRAETAPTPLVLTEAVPQPVAEPVTKVPATPELTPAPLQLDVPLRAEEAIADGSSDSLRDFATRAGAATLPDLLEASAAFVTLVNGRPSFSRGEIMRLVDTFSDDGGFSQEARIKSFGALIRGGRIQRTDTGDFEISRAARASYETSAAG